MGSVNAPGAFPRGKLEAGIVPVLPALVRSTSESTLTEFLGVILAILICSPATLLAQTRSATTAAQTPPAQTAQSQTPQSEKPKKKSKAKLPPQTGPKETGPRQTKRMLWVAPNFGAVSAGVEFKPMTAKQKFHLAFDDSFDYSSFTWTGIQAAQGLLTRSDPEFGTGPAGYGRYYWHDYVDGVSGTYFTEAIVPALTHEDPRYFTLGHGGFFRRTAYALTRTIITRDDNGHWGFNWSEVGGNAMEATLSDAYYPAGDRGVNQTITNWGLQMESAALNNLAKEFWPDIRHDLFRQN